MADASLGTAVLHTKLDTSQLRIGLSTAEKDTRSAVQRISADLAGIGKNLQGIGARLSIGLTAPLTAIGAVGVRSAMQLETFSKSLTVLIGDTNRAQAAFEELYEFSANTTFEWRSLTEGTRVLAAFGVEAEDLVPTLSMLGDVAAGLDTPLEDLAQIFGRVRITGRAGMEEINRLADRGVPVYTELARVMGVSEGAVRDLVSAGAVGFPQMEQMFVNLTSEGGMFFGMMAAQTDTTAGRLARLKDSFEQVTDIIGERLVPAFDKLVAAGQAATDWFVNLDESTQGLLVGLGITLSVTGPILVGIGTLLVQLPKLVASFTALRAAITPLLGPAGILMAAVAGFIALNNAMDAGRQQRQAAQDSFDNLITRMGAYRNELTVTSEAERQAAVEALQRQRRVLEVTIQNQQAFIRSVEADVIAFANKGFFGQLFSFGEANVNIKTLEQAEQHLSGLQTELGKIDSSIERITNMEIPKVDTTAIPTVTNQVRELGTTATEVMELPDPSAAARLWTGRLAAEIRFGMRDASSALDIVTPRLEELRAEAASALAEFGFDSSEYQDLISKLEVVEGFVNRITGAAKPLSLTPTAAVTGARDLSVTPTAQVDMTGLRSPAMVRAELEAARAARDAAGTVEELAAAREDVERLERELSRLTDGVQLSVQAFARVPEAVAVTAPAVTAVVPAARPITAPGVTAEVDMAGLRSIAAIEAELATARAELRSAGTEAGRLTAQALVTELEAELSEAVRRVTPVQLEVRPSAVIPGAVPLGITPTATIDGMDPAEWVRAQQQATADQKAAADQFANTVVSAGFAFGDAAIKAFQDGDVVGVIRAGLGGAGSILGGANLGSIGFLGGSIGIGGLIAGGLGLLGTLIGALAGGGSRDAEERRRREQQQARSVPAVNINFTVNQSNTYNGAPRDPANEQAFSRQADALFESIYRRHLGPRLDRIEQRLGIAGA